MTTGVAFLASADSSEGAERARHRLHERLFAVLFLAAVATLVGLSAYSFNSGIELSDLARQRAVLRERLNTDALLLQAILDTELQIRALLLTDDNNFVPEVQQARSRSQVRLEAFAALIEQAQRTPELPASELAPRVARLARDAIAEFDTGLTAWQSDARHTARQRWLLSGTSGRIIVLRQDLENMQMRNEDLLNALRVRFDATLRNRFRVVTASNITALVWIIGVFFWLRHDRKLRWRTEGALRKASHAATAADRAKSEFMANMSHEIRTPLNAVVGMNDLLLGTPLNAEQMDYARISRDAGSALLHIVNDILDFSRLDTHSVTIDVAPFSLVELVESQADIIAARARDKDVQLYCFVEPKLQALRMGDAARIAQVLLNLLGNAVKFTPSSGSIRLHVQGTTPGASAENATVRFEVIDTGIGIDADVQARLFEPFTQGDNTMTRRYGGTGLGLSISRGLVELMQGRIGVHSTRGLGSTFFVELNLPLCEPKAPVQAAPSGPLVGLVALVFDPDAAAADIAAQILAQWGVDAQIVHDAAAAEQAILAAKTAQHPIDVVMLRMSEPQAEAFVATMRGTEAFCMQKTPVIFSPQSASPIGATREHPVFDAQLFVPVKQTEIFETLCRLCRPQDNLQWAAGPLSAPAPAAPTRISPPPHLILVAEDTPINQILALKQLEKLGYSAHAVANGREALEALTRITYALVLMDCQMPELDGYETTGAIRALEASGARAGHLPIVALTANALQGDAEKCLAAGMDAYLSKPFRKEDLLATLKRFLG